VAAVRNDLKGKTPSFSMPELRGGAANLSSTAAITAKMPGQAPIFCHFRVLSFEYQGDSRHWCEF
jgi:hypothetical protein